MRAAQTGRTHGCNPTARHHFPLAPQGLSTHGLASRIEPTLNADGTVSLDIDDCVQATLMFKGDDTIVYAVVGAAPGKAEFFDDHIPGEVLALLRG